MQTSFGVNSVAAREAMLVMEQSAQHSPIAHLLGKALFMSCMAVQLKPEELLYGSAIFSPDLAVVTK